MKISQSLLWAAVTAALLFGTTAKADRIKDLAYVAGVRTNHLVGYGLVAGLDGNGDMTTQTPFTIQSLKSMLRQFGIKVPEGNDPRLKNVAAVAVDAELPPFAKPGQKIDVTISSLGNARSLRGGMLLMTPLKGADGRVYAVAQGNVVVGGFGASGQSGSSVTVNIPTAGRIPNGASVERAAPSSFGGEKSLVLDLNSPDFTTAKRMMDTINSTFGLGTAHALDGSSVMVAAPHDRSQRVSFISLVENLTLDPGESAAKVVINSRTGTVVIGEHVHVTPAAVSHGNLTVTISERKVVSQPGPLSGGSTKVVPKSNVQIKQDGQHMFLFDSAVSLNNIVRAVNQVGAAPSDLVAILEALKEAGALHAQLIVI